MRFEFTTATRIIFGSGTIQEVAPLALEIGKGLHARLRGDKPLPATCRGKPASHLAGKLAAVMDLALPVSARLAMARAFPATPACPEYPMQEKEHPKDGTAGRPACPEYPMQEKEHPKDGTAGRSVLIAGLYPFVVGDLLKIVLAAVLLPTGWKLIVARRSSLVVRTTNHAP